MSLLIEKLNKPKKTASQPMGFRTGRDDAGDSGMILIAGVPVNAVDNIREITAGADAVYLKADGSSLSVTSVEEIVKAIPEIPCGISTEETGKAKMDSYLKAGCDFLVFSADSAVASLPDNEDTGKLLKIDINLEDSLVRVVNNLPVDAVITTELFNNNKAITWHELMAVQRIAVLITKPVIIPVSTAISPGELKAIRNADVEGVMVEVDPAAPGKMEEIRQTIQNLPPKSTPKHGKTDALLPRGNAAGSVTPDEDDDYE